MRNQNEKSEIDTTIARNYSHNVNKNDTINKKEQTFQCDNNLSIKLNNCGTSRNNYRNNQNGLQSYLSTKQSNFYSSTNNQLSNMLMPKIEVRPQSKTKRIYKLGSVHMKTQSDAMMFNSPNSKGTTKSKRFIKGNGTLGYNLINSPSNVPATERGSGYKKKKMIWKRLNWISLILIKKKWKKKNFRG